MEKKYKGTVYIGVVGGDNEIGPCRDSIERIQKREGDQGPYFFRATKGYEARQQHLNNFIDSHHDFILLLDHDQYFETNTLEQLRSHQLPFVSGLIMRRDYETLAPVWYRPYNGQWPMEPWIGEIEGGKLHKIGAGGWGCVLIHRNVVLAVREILKGELEVLEDDMDIYPYDLKRIMSAINNIEKTADMHEKIGMQIEPRLLREDIKMLREEIRPLRCDRDQVGSDIRFPFFALQAGYQLMGDPDVKCGHNVNFPLHPDHYRNNAPKDELEKARKKTHKFVTGERKRLQEQKAEVENA